MKPETGTIDFVWDGTAVSVGYDRLGSGPSVLLLPAPSSISTRREMSPLQERLAPYFSTVAIDWPGFGDAPRPAVDWTPQAYRAFLEFVLKMLAPSPFAIVAAGHGAGYALACAGRMPETALCLIAPTWRGPLPTMTAKARRWAPGIVRVGDLPGLGQLLYRLNVNPPVMRLMAREHVYADPDWLGGERLAKKNEVVGASGARHASLRFVTGQLDPMRSRDAFLDCARKVTAPMLVAYGAGTPVKSMAEMRALAELPGVRAAALPEGRLSVHEEFPDAVAEAVLAFLGKGAGRGAEPTGSA